MEIHASCLTTTELVRPQIRSSRPRRELEGFISSRASVLIFGSVGGQLRILHDIEHTAGRLGEAGAAKGGGDDLVVMTTKAKKITNFTAFSTGAFGGHCQLNAAAFLSKHYCVDHGRRVEQIRRLRPMVL
jgi:hypothetical protein